MFQTELHPGFHSNFVNRQNQQTMTDTHYHLPTHISLRMQTHPHPFTTAPSAPFHGESSIPLSFNSRATNSSSVRSDYHHMNAGNPQAFNTHSNRHSARGLQPVVHSSHTSNTSIPRTSADIGGVSAPIRGYSVPRVSSPRNTKSNTRTKTNSSRSHNNASLRNGFRSTSSYGSLASTHGLPRMHSHNTSSTSGTMNRSNVTSSQVSSSYSASARPQVQWYSQGLHHNSALQLNSRQLREDRAHRKNFRWKPRNNATASLSIGERFRSRRTH